MEVLGPSLEDLFNFCGRCFTLRTVLMIAFQCLDRIMYMHKKNFIHRDIKPDNILIGTKDNANCIYLIDFGLSKRFYNPKNDTFTPYKENKSLTGTLSFTLSLSHSHTHTLSLPLSFSLSLSLSLSLSFTHAYTYTVSLRYSSVCKFKHTYWSGTVKKVKKINVTTLYILYIYIILYIIIGMIWRV